jgi:hypothetical protein
MIDRAIKDKAIPPSMAYLVYHRFGFVALILLTSTSDVKLLYNKLIYKDRKYAKVNKETDNKGTCKNYCLHRAPLLSKS